MSKWISCKERMPHDLESCIVVREGLCQPCNMYWDSIRDYWRPDGYGFESKELFVDITHWQPLPEPPKK
jgi:hypothetical protein